MWMILELARVWENCVFLVFSLRSTSVWGSDPGRLCRWLKARQERTKIQYFNFIFYFINMYLHFFAFPSWFSHRCLCSFLCLDSQTRFSCILLSRTQLGVPITMFTVLQRTRLMNNTTWKDLRNIPDSHWSSVLSACSWIYWFGRFIECGGMCCSARQPDSWPLLSFCRPFLLE